MTERLDDVEYIELHDAVLGSLRYDVPARSLSVTFCEARTQLKGDDELYESDIELHASNVEHLTLCQMRHPDSILWEQFRSGPKTWDILDVLRNPGAALDDVDIRMNPFAVLSFRASSAVTKVSWQVARPYPRAAKPPPTLPVSQAAADLRLPGRGRYSALLSLSMWMNSEHDLMSLVFREPVAPDGSGKQRLVQLVGIGMDLLSAWRLSECAEIVHIQPVAEDGSPVELTDIGPQGFGPTSLHLKLRPAAVMVWDVRSLAMRVVDDENDLILR